ncbi:MAG: VCBS repeat-containing protein [Acidobacteria bacterium]|nr:VCBS repeat-containing protein [Acidobacteriota bacterium]
MLRNSIDKSSAIFLLLGILALLHWGAVNTRAEVSCQSLEFTSTGIITVSEVARDVAVGDFNGDGKMDVVVTGISSSISGLYSAPGDGQGHLGLKRFFITYNFVPVSPTVADFNGDGKLDVAAGEVSGSRVAIIYGDGTGSFSRMSLFDTGLAGPNSVGGAVDLNGDGRPDLVVANRESNKIQILFNRGHGRMVFSAAYTVGASPRDVETGDFDGDGKTDIAVANHDSSDVSILYSIGGSGNFGGAVNYNVGHPLYALTVADFNGDGKTDFAASGNEYVTVIQNNGAGFNAPADYAAPGCDISTSLAVGDFNGDQKLDIAVANLNGNGAVAVLRGTGTGSFLSAVGLWRGIKSVAAADFNGDGRTDILTHENNDAVLLSSGCAARSHKIDYDGDNRTDFAVWRPSNGNWYVLNSGDNTLRVELWGSASLGDVPVPGDYDGDDKTDVAVFRRSNGMWYIHRSSDGAVQAQAFGAANDKPVQGDYDGDGKTDLAIWRATSGGWFIRQSSDGVVRGVQWGSGELGDQPVQGDYDNDGKTDVAVVRTSARHWFVYNSSNGTVTDAVWGTADDKPIVYGMGAQTYIAFYRTTNNAWYIYPGASYAYVEGGGDVPVPGDYDGDNQIDAAMLRTASGTWAVHRSANMNFTYQFGLPGDIPVSVPYLME